jgi:hypothetical protein
MLGFRPLAQLLYQGLWGYEEVSKIWFGLLLPLEREVWVCNCVVRGGIVLGLDRVDDGWELS